MRPGRRAFSQLGEVVVERLILDVDVPTWRKICQSLADRGTQNLKLRRVRLLALLDQPQAFSKHLAGDLGADATNSSTNSDW